MTRDAVVNQAKAWLGLNENDGSHREVIDAYNELCRPLARGYKVSYGDAWCDTFVSAVFAKCGGGIPYECGCEEHINRLIDAGMYTEDDGYTPNKGDIIFFDWKDSGEGDDTGRAQHVGIVERVSGDTIHIIEGNNGNAVRRTTRKINGRYIRGFGLPRFEEEQAPAPVEEPKQEQAIVEIPKSEAGITEIALQVIRGNYGNGEERKRRLAEAGYDYATVQAEVNRILDKEEEKPRPSNLSNVALAVIRGDYGNGAERRERLHEAGYDYDAVQALVNQMMRTGAY